MTDTSSHSDAPLSSPFQEEIDLDNYYASESSKRVLLSINQAVADGTRLMVLTGEEGSGKTMLCNKLDRDPQDVFTTVFFPRTVDSFEDVVRIVALGLGLDLKQGDESRTVDTLLDEISEVMVQGGLPLFLIFDEAENIYLATLERIRKMLDRLSEDGGRIHVLFAGRKTFLENCQQLSMCAFTNNEEYQINLDPLSEEETVSYIQYCSSKIPGIDSVALFTPEVIKNIYEISGGNFRMINILAEEAVQKDGDDTSFMVLLENVKEEGQGEAKGRDVFQLVQQYFQQYRSYLPYAAVFAGILCIGGVFLFSSDNEETDTAAAPPAEILREVEKPVVIKIEPAKQVEAEISTSVKIPNVVSVQETSPPIVTNDEPKQIATENVAQQLPEVEIEVEQQTKFSDPSQEQPVQIEDDPVQEVVAQEAKPVKPIIETPVEDVVEIVTLVRDSKTKKRPGRLPKTTQVTIKEQIKKEKSRNEVREVIASNAHFTIEQLYKKRLMAGSSWYNNQKNDKYTVQLMVLTSETAEKNLKKMLREDRYRQEAGNFYIFKKLSTSDTLFVFYGEYSTIAKARLAQNSLPRFLRDHKPYAISIKGAMAKVRR